ncbi:hypothetical protein [Bradyrhizobium canariense]|uniref:hypothetical protein n=1 Tax=Bradyrhizobium canariense TaxID=255045 RepID=UPI001B8A1831|nr:hypothetical protein [Bradyrhizobium canariense]MBR0952613.1 hypothetical protein [Bradyrhizobium canariense]
MADARQDVVSSEDSSGVSPQASPRSVDLALRSAIDLKNFAVRRGLPVPDSLLKEISDIRAAVDGDKPPKNIDSRVDAVLRDLTSITWPTTTRTLEFAAQKGEINFFQKHFRALLFALLCFSLFLSIAGLIAARSQYAEVGKHLFPLALGLLGSTTYIFFSLMNVVSERAIDESDVFSSYARLMLGPAFGWLFAQIFSVSFDGVGAAGNPGSSANIRSQLMLLIPFLAGFSTRLVLGIVNQSIQAIEIALGLGDKRTELKARSTTRK